MTTDEWLKKGEEIGRENEYADEEIEEYMMYIKAIMSLNSNGNC